MRRASAPDFFIGRSEQPPIDLLEQALELLFMRRAEDENTAALCRRKPDVVQIIPVQRHQRAPQLGGKAEMFDVGGAAKVFFLHDEEDVPPKPLAHETDEAGRQVGVAIDSRAISQPFGKRRKPGR